MDAYAEQALAQAVSAGMPAELAIDYPDALAMLRAAVARAAEKPAVHYFDATLSWRDVDIESDALAAALCERGVQAGDRVALYLQNTPYFLIGMLAAWKAGAIVVPVNPMNREREVGLLLANSTPTALICHDTLYRDVVLKLPDAQRGLVPKIVLTTSPLDLQSRNDPRLFRGVERVATPGADDLGETIERHRGQRPPAWPTKPDDIAFLVYTSGTTGLPKGATNTHANVAYNAQVYRDWIALEDGVGVLGVAPLFHITGLVGHLLVAIITASPVTLTYRFDAGAMLDAAAERRPGFTVAAITALMAMMNHPDATADQFASVTKVYSGGAPIPPAVVEAFRGEVRQLRAQHLRPDRDLVADPWRAARRGRPGRPRVWRALDRRADSRRAGVDRDRRRPAGAGGRAGRDRQLRTDGRARLLEQARRDRRGDAAGRLSHRRRRVHGRGRLVLPDRPQEGHDQRRRLQGLAARGGGRALHPPRGARGRRGRGQGRIPRRNGEGVVSLKAGAKVTADELIDHCKARMAAYKYPRQLEIIDELPKTVTGKILRRALRG